MIKKYEMLDDFKVHMGKKLYRIAALKDIEKYGVKAGDLGGWIEKEENLSHSGDCWVGGNARVYGNAVVSDDAWVYDNADISGRALVYGNALVFENSVVKDFAQVYEDAQIYSDAVIGDHAHICGDAWISDNVRICRNAVVKRDADYVYIDGLGETREAITAFKCKDKHIILNGGSFCERIEDFIVQTPKSEEHFKFAELVKIHFKSEVNDNE